MNNQLFAPCVALIALALGTTGVVTGAFAQTTNTPTSTSTPPTCTAGGWHHKHHGDSVLTAAEKAQLKKAKEQALAGNGSLQADETSLKQQFAALKGGNATPDQRKALHEQKQAFHAKLKAAELLIDPTLAPIFQKLEAAHQGHHHSET